MNITTIESGWIVTADYISDDDCNNDGKQAGKQTVCVLGPRGISDDMTTRLKQGEGVRFKMYDDDMTLYYEGKAINCDFEPLDHYGEPNAGCTSIWYATGVNGKFEQL